MNRTAAMLDFVTRFAVTARRVTDRRLIVSVTRTMTISGSNGARRVMCDGGFHTHALEADQQIPIK